MYYSYNHAIIVGNAEITNGNSKHLRDHQRSNTGSLNPYEITNFKDQLNSEVSSIKESSKYIKRDETRHFTTEPSTGKIAVSGNERKIRIKNLSNN